MTQTWGPPNQSNGCRFELSPILSKYVEYDFNLVHEHLKFKSRILKARYEQYKNNRIQNQKKTTRLGVDMVKPWNSVKINLVLGLRGPDIRPGLNNSDLIIEGHRGLRR